MASSSSDVPSLEVEVGKDKNPPTSPRPYRLPSVAATFPILCTAETKRYGAATIPAVKYSFEDGSWAVFPLSREEFGSVWSSCEDMRPWRPMPLEMTWSEAMSHFTPHTHYAVPFLRALLRVLQDKVYADGSAVSVNNWRTECKLSSAKIPVILKCSRCFQNAVVSPRSLYAVPKELDQIVCAMLGEECLTPPEGISHEDNTPTLNLFHTCHSQVRSRDNACSSFAPTSPTFAMPAPQRPPQTLWTTMCRMGTLPQLTPSAPTFFGSSSFTHPSQFIAGPLVESLHSPDPTTYEIEECHEIMRQKKWQELVTALLKWNARHNVQGFAGKPDVVAFHTWADALETFFEVWQVANSALKAQLATVTFVDNAQRWWSAHKRQRPNVALTFTQLCEWIARELVPTADPAHTALAWYQLRYRGDVEAYLSQLDNLLLHHPLDPRVSHTLAVQPFGQDAVERVLAQDDARGPEGITMIQLKRMIRCFAQQEDERRKQFAARRNQQQGLNRSPYVHRVGQRAFQQGRPFETHKRPPLDSASRPH